MSGVILSINPKWWHRIRSGEKDGEIRKTFPKLDLPFTVYVYCTKKESLLSIIKDGDDCYGEEYHGKPIFLKTPDGYSYERGHIVGEFVCDSVISISFNGDVPEFKNVSDDMTFHTCVSVQDTINYLGGKEGYIWHVSNVIAYKNPYTLEEFGLKRPPQSWQYVRRNRMDKALCPYCGREMKVEELLPFSGDCAYTCECAGFVAERNRYRRCQRRPLQKPLSLEEACEADPGCFVEIKGQIHMHLGTLFPQTIYEIGKRKILINGSYFSENSYRKTWRCWAAKPTQEEQEAAKWE